VRLRLKFSAAHQNLVPADATGLREGVGSCKDRESQHKGREGRTEHFERFEKWLSFKLKM